MAGKRARRFLRFVLWGLAIVILLLVLTPLWFPWVLRPVAKRYGATFKAYERGGYLGFSVREVSYSNRTVRVSAGRIEVAPFRGQVMAADWAVVVGPSKRKSTNVTRSVHRVYQKVSKIVSNVQHWIPEAALTNGYVATPNVTVQVPGVAWSGIQLSGQAQISNALPLTTVRATLPTQGAVRARLSNDSLDLRSSLTVSNSPAALLLHAESRWRTNAFTAVATFATNGALPVTAALVATGVVFPPVKGSITGKWEQNRYVVDARGQMLERPISFAGRINGNTESARLEAGEVATPWGKASVQGELAFARTAHRGSALARNLSLGRLNPFDLAVDWSGEKFNLTNIHATVRANETVLAATGTADVKEKRFQVSELTLGTNRIDLTADVRWPQSASVCAQMTNLSVKALEGLINWPYADVLVDHLRLGMGWTNGPVVGDADFMGRTILEDGTQLGAAAALVSDGKGITIINVTFTRNGAPVSAAYGFLPILVKASKPQVTPITNAPVDLHVTAHREAFFWKLLESQAEADLREPEVRADVSGTWKSPTARVTARAAGIKFRNVAAEVPGFDDLSMVAHVRGGAVEIEFLNFFVTNQPVTFSALMPLQENFWDAPHRNAAKLDWRDLTCRVKIDSAQIAAFVPLLPALIAPQGIVDADIGLIPGGKLDGRVRIDGAGTRPIASLGALQDIEIVCRLGDGKARVNSYVALGGYSVLGAGEIEVNPNQLLRGRLPPFDFHITGKNVPLTRQPDAIIRADVDVNIRHATNLPVTISGELNLRDSLYLRELRDLVPGRLASAERRPPYFSVEAQPFAAWRVDLTVAGERFLKIRTPIFNGEVSADFRVSGTLGNPVAIGDVMIDAGLVRFPFGNIPVNQGIVSLTSDNPYRPQLLINGNDRVLGYDIQMQLTGYADAPVLQFSSTPPLNSDQILLMLTAGEIPRQGQFSFTTEQRAQRLALFLGRGMLSDLGIGGDANRLTVRSGENVTDTGRPTYSVEYELTDDWSVIGQYDRFNDFNLMLRWRVYEK